VKATARQPRVEFRLAPDARRYRVAPRQHPILFRRRLMQSIAHELRKTGLVVSRKPVQYSDTAL
jgi:hypothetical protein